MTLVEVLIAFLILSLVGALAFSLILGSRRSLERQLDWADRLEPASLALEALAEDLASALVPDRGEAPVFRLQEDASGRSELLLATAAPPDGPDVPLDRFQVMRVEWRVEPDKAGRPGLVRTARPLVVSGEGGEKRFRQEGVAGLAVRVYDPVRKEWVAAWLAGLNGSLPAAARVELKIETSRGMKTMTRETVIPAGLLISPAR